MSEFRVWFFGGFRGSGLVGGGFEFGGRLLTESIWPVLIGVTVVSHLHEFAP